MSPDATKITLAPANVDVKVGEDTRMQCAASHDPSLDITFIWSLEGQVIDLYKDSQHYERTLVSLRSTGIFPILQLKSCLSHLRSSCCYISLELPTSLYCIPLIAASAHIHFC